MINQNYIKNQLNISERNMDYKIEEYVKGKFNIIPEVTAPEANGVLHHKGLVDDPGTMEEIERITSEFNENDVFIDCGAHIGMMALSAKKGRTIAIESNPESYKLLRKMVRVNPKKDIDILNLALYNEEMEYEVAPETWTGMSQINKEKTGQYTITGDNLMKVILRPNEKVKLIKIDCEKSTNQVLLGFEETIRKFKPTLIVEKSEDNFHFYRKIKYTVKKGFNVNEVADGTTD